MPRVPGASTLLEFSISNSHFHVAPCSLLQAFPNAEIILNPTKPRRGSFECTMQLEDGKGWFCLFIFIYFFYFFRRAESKLYNLSAQPSPFSPAPPLRFYHTLVQSCSSGRASSVARPATSNSPSSASSSRTFVRSSPRAAAAATTRPRRPRRCKC